jgi:uncharacterized membrane protein (DUF106 family)
VNKIPLNILGNITNSTVQFMQPIFSLKPLITIFLFSFVLTLLIAIINKFLVNRKVMKEVKTKMTEIRENLSKAQKSNDTEAVNKYMSEYMSINTQYMKQTFKSLLISIIVIMLFLPLLNLQYKGVTVLNLPFPLPIVGTKSGWFLWYFIVSLSTSIIFKKIIGE